MKDKEITAWTIENLYIEYKTRIDKAIEIVEELINFLTYH